MSNCKLIGRYFLLIISLFFMGLGISLITKSNLGTSPISSVAYVLSMIFPMTFGQFNFLLTCSFFFIIIIIQGKDFPKAQFLQVLVALFLGLFVDLGMTLFASVNPDSYVGKLSALLFGCVILAWGIYLQVTADVIINPGEGVVKAIADKVSKEFGIVKILFDCSLVITAVIISLFALGTIKGLREGTFISAFLVGYIVKIIGGIFRC
ncbi:MAG: YczE/YyaS/YitT family protein [Bacteroidota bacterium]